ncbi:MAG: hypothetical protein P8K68_00195 [Algibacter sp.]|uniref:hypothetical protein n=1 Tax=Algibacter sp. TaxID=1872428 RepID=UPI0026226AE5|nr:hypothetical protein [Algibacter sp.]MDG1728957.1 hypothetical protein [Algibacter sp.]MDG2177195.1 hypothetical protein [Algibacter sp.]
MKIKHFEEQLNHFVKNINKHYSSDRIQGMFFIVQTYEKDKIDLYNRHTFYEHYYLKSLRDYCQNKLISDWKFEYGSSESRLFSKIYMCCLCSDASDVKYREFAEGYFEGKRFIYKEI